MSDSEQMNNSETNEDPVLAEETKAADGTPAADAAPASDAPEAAKAPEATETPAPTEAPEPTVTTEAAAGETPAAVNEAEQGASEPPEGEASFHSSTTGQLEAWTMPDDEEEEEAEPAEPPEGQITQQDVKDCFVTDEMDWDAYRHMQKVAVSSDANRRVFESHTLEIDENSSTIAATKKGACLYVLGKVKAAKETLELAHPKSIMASVLLGQLLEDAEKFEEAKSAYASSYKAHPTSKASVFGLVKVLYVLGEKSDADAMLEKCMTEFEDDPELHFLKGFTEELEGEYDAAREEYEKVLEKDPDHARALFRLGRYHMTWGDEDKAVEYYERCCSQVPTYGNALINLGLLYEDRNNYEDACRCYQTVLKAIPDHIRATMFLKDALASKSMYYDEERERRQDRQNQVLKIPVSDFELSVRSRNCLNKMNIKTLGDLMNMTEPELLAHKNFGETSLLEVKQMLAQKGLRLGQNRGQASGFVTRTGTTKALPKEDVVKQSVANLELSVRSRNCMNRLGIKTLEELLSRSEQELLAAKNFGETSLNEIKSRLSELGLSLRRGGR